MKKLKIIIIVVGVSMIAFSCENNTSNSTNALTDLFSSTHQVVKIGNQSWTTKNLDLTRFRNGDEVPVVKTWIEWDRLNEEQKPACCYKDFDESNLKYGVFYNFYAVSDSRGIAPNGFHIPTLEEWEELINTLGGDSIATAKLQSQSGWEMDRAILDLGTQHYSKNGTNSSGFTAIPAGGLDGAYFEEIGTCTSWWAKPTEVAVGDFKLIDGEDFETYDVGAYITIDNYIFPSFHFKISPPNPNMGGWRALSIRCIKDSRFSDIETRNIKGYAIRNKNKTK